jgi:alpha-beta hydrolase superfamily lysophospholipase
MHLEALENKDAVKAATIKVENINGPVFLLSGKKDQWWPSTEMSDEVMKRLSENNFKHLKVSSHTPLDCDHYVLNELGAIDLVRSKVLEMIEYCRSQTL